MAKTTEPTDKPGAMKEKVVLAIPHIHGGEQKKAGESIDVTAAQKTWLTKRGIVATEQPTGE